MKHRCLIILAVLAGGCSRDWPSPLPDRAGLGATVDAESGEVRTYQANLYWSLRPER